MPVVLAVAALLVAPPALGVLGTSLADVPYIGLATAYVPWYLPWLTVASVVGGVLAMIHWGLRGSRIAAVLAVVAALTVAGAAVDVRRLRRRKPRHQHRLPVGSRPLAFVVWRNHAEGESGVGDVSRRRPGRSLR